MDFHELKYHEVHYFVSGHIQSPSFGLNLDDIIGVDARNLFEQEDAQPRGTVA